MAPAARRSASARSQIVSASAVIFSRGTCASTSPRRTPFSASSRSAASGAPSSAWPPASGSDGSAPAIAASSSAASATERASGPWVSRYGQVGITPVRGTSPNVGFIPTTPVQTAGIRLDPPSSVPARRTPCPPRPRPPTRRWTRQACACRSDRSGLTHLAGVAARAVAAIGEVVCRRLAEHDRAGRAQPRNLDRVAPHRFRKEPRPLRVRRGGRQAVHVVDRLGEHRHAVERAAQFAAAPAGIGGLRISHGRRRQGVDGTPCHAVGAAALERARGDLGGAPSAARRPAT